MQSWIMLYSQTANSPLIEQVTFVLDHTSTICVSITTTTFISLLLIVISNTGSRLPFESDQIEWFWILLPTAILYFIGSPSLNLLEHIETLENPIITINAIGHQWYWSYEYAETNSIEFDCFIESNSNIRLLLTNNQLILPANTTIRIIVTSEDVIHSWAVPSLGVNIDAIPGRLNQIPLFLKRSGLIIGQCSELCGAGHSFIPITISSLPLNEFNNSINIIINS